MDPKSRLGFTLIELLVVISVIGMLSGMILVAMNGVRAKARDARRMHDIDQIRKALELYYLQNNQYPASGGATSPNNGWSNSNNASWATLQTALSPHLAVLPQDPVNSAGSWAGASGNYTYTYFSSGYGCSQQWYMLVYRLEKTTKVSPGVTTCNGTNFNYSGTVTVGMKQK